MLTRCSVVSQCSSVMLMSFLFSCVILVSMSLAAPHDEQVEKGRYPMALLNLRLVNVNESGSGIQPNEVT